MNTQTGNMFANLPPQLPVELFETLCQQHNLKIERIISRGQCSPTHEWYDQEQDEWVLLLQGAARLQFAKDNFIINLTVGDYVWIPAHEKHRVAWTDPHTDSIWLAIHLFSPVV